ncbi:molybdopterin-containing oxidoreductase family protein [Thiohalorhabdus sp. Cl-TMA]|uniref:Molybdopterin-dependent oxidoreductase n=1 Tax=Thiohalorhabdus methylotrophus TaxID=3242694 RepID=A0ABV4U1E8_9GAMM
MGAEGTTWKRTTCYECDANCAFDVALNRAGQAVDLKGPNCPRGTAQLEREYHPERLLHPLKRVGPKGSGRFERISWDEALDTIAGRLSEIRETHGAEQAAFFAGYTKEARPQLQRLAHAFGSPNYLTESGCCFSATLAAEKLTLGYRLKSASLLEAEETRCLLVWSTNPPASVVPFEDHHAARSKAGRAMVVVDPRRTETAEAADIHLQIRPGTDGALALAFHNVIFENGWADEAFLKRWALGWNSLRDYARAFSPEHVSRICGVDADAIRRAAELYATSGPAQIALSPTATVQHSNGFQNHRAIVLLPAVTGNLDIPGGNRFFLDKVRPKPIDLFRETIGELPPRLGEERFPVWTRYWPAGQSMLLPDAILTGQPQPIQALFAIGINASMWPNSRRMLAALEALDFFACSDFFLTETAKRADIVLPAATNLEREALVAYPGCQFRGEVRYRQAVLAPRGEARPDARIALDLGVRLGMPERFWHGDLAASWAEAAEGLTEEVRRRAYEDPDGAMVFSDVLEEEGFAGERLYELRGFPTASGRIEFDSQELRGAGYDGLPVYREPAESPLASPALAEDYPFVLTSGGRSKYYTHSQQQRFPGLAAKDPVPRAQIHPWDADAQGIRDGADVVVRTPRGAVTFTAEVTDAVKPGVVHCFHGWSKADVNQLTDHLHLDPISGFPPFKSGLCALALGEAAEPYAMGE